MLNHGSRHANPTTPRDSYDGRLVRSSEVALWHTDVEDLGDGREATTSRRVQLDERGVVEIAYGGAVAAHAPMVKVLAP